MDLETAQRHIQAAFERMRACYLKPVFDEWAILAVGAKSGVVAYEGPRADVFTARVQDDSEPLRAQAAGQQFADGDLEFVHDAAKTRYDAFLKAGPSSFLVLNHTVKSMEEIRADGKWLKAQAVLFELSEKFRADPLRL